MVKVVFQGVKAVTVTFQNRKDARNILRAVGFKGSHSPNGDVFQNEAGQTVTVSNRYK